jgi:hypothetical protein
VAKQQTLHEHATRLLALAISARDRGNLELAESLTLRAMEIFDRASPAAQRAVVVQRLPQIHPNKSET